MLVFLYVSPNHFKIIIFLILSSKRLFLKWWFRSWRHHYQFFEPSCLPLEKSFTWSTVQKCIFYPLFFASFHLQFLIQQHRSKTKYWLFKLLLKVAFKLDLFFKNPYWNFSATVALSVDFFFSVFRYGAILSKSHSFNCGNLKFSTVPLPERHYEKTRITLVTCMCVYNFKDLNKLVDFTYMQIKLPC